MVHGVVCFFGVLLLLNTYICAVIRYPSCLIDQIPFLNLIIDTPTHKKKKEHRRKIMFNYNIHCSGVIRDFRSNNVLDVLTI
jgi:hypothetical protein